MKFRNSIQLCLRHRIALHHVKNGNTAAIQDAREKDLIILLCQRRTPACSSTTVAEPYCREKIFWEAAGFVGPSRVYDGAFATHQRVYLQPWVGGEHMSESSPNNQPVEWKQRAAEKVLPDGSVVVILVVSFTHSRSFGPLGCGAIVLP